LAASPLPFAVLGCVALVLLGLCWSLASPPGASPDDDFHLSTIWCHTGDPDVCRRTGEEIEPGIERVLVAPGLGPACYGLREDVSAACLEESTSRTGLEPSRADDGLYPGGFHRLMSLFAGANVDRSVVVMRMVSWLLAMALLVAAGALAGPDLRRAFSLAALTSFVPMGLYLFASNNPSGLTVAGVAAYWCAIVVAMAGAGRRRRRVAASVALVSAIVALGSRSDAGVYLAVASLAAWISTGGYLPGLRRRSLFPAGVAAAGLAATLAGTQTQRVGEGGVRLEPPSLTVSLFDNALELPRLVTGSLGTSDLGAYDVPMPGAVSTLMLLAFGGALMAGLSSVSPAKWVASAVVGGALVGIPLVVLTEGRYLVGDPRYVQPRYLLPLLPVLVGTVLLAPRGGRRIRLTRGQVALLVSAVALAHAAALHTTIRRYVTGLDVRGPDLGESVEWWWGTGPGPLTTWAVGSLAFVVVAVLVSTLVRREAQASPTGERTLPG
jgi:hypothetical protein